MAFIREYLEVRNGLRHEPLAHRLQKGKFHGKKDTRKYGPLLGQA